MIQSASTEILTETCDLTHLLSTSLDDG